MADYTPKTRFGEVLQTGAKGVGKGLEKAFEPETFANVVLPLAGIAEAIASKGASPGTGALGMMEARNRGIADRLRREELTRKREIEDEERRQKAIERAKLKAYHDEAATIPVTETGKRMEVFGKHFPEKWDAYLMAQKPLDDRSTIKMTYEQFAKDRGKEIGKEYPYEQAVVDFNEFVRNNPGNKYTLGHGSSAIADAIARQQLATPPKVPQSTSDAVSSAHEGGEKFGEIVGWLRGKGEPKGLIDGVTRFLRSTWGGVPFFGGLTDPDMANYHNMKRQTSEVFLRDATGAAAPPYEVRFYAGLLPDYWESDYLKQAKLDNYKTRVMSRAMGKIKTMKTQARGLEKHFPQKAAAMHAMADAYMNDMNNLVLSLPRIVSEEDMKNYGRVKVPEVRKEFGSVQEAEQAAAEGFLEPGDPIQIGERTGTWQ